METQVCVICQNKNSINRTNNRLVTESCGHVKCMGCLLSETTGCRACKLEKSKENTGGNLETDVPKVNEILQTISDETTESQGVNEAVDKIVIAKEPVCPASVESPKVTIVASKRNAMTNVLISKNPVCPTSVEMPKVTIIATKRNAMTDDLISKKPVRREIELPKVAIIETERNPVTIINDVLIAKAHLCPPTVVLPIATIVQLRNNVTDDIVKKPVFPTNVELPKATIIETEKNPTNDVVISKTPVCSASVELAKATIFDSERKTVTHDIVIAKKPGCPTSVELAKATVFDSERKTHDIIIAKKPECPTSVELPKATIMVPEKDSVTVTNDVVTAKTPKMVCPASIELPKVSEKIYKSDKKDWSTKAVFKDEMPHIRVDKNVSGTTVYYCLKCSREFRARSHVNYHAYCNGRDKPYQCNECDKEFSTASHYQYHVSTHSPARPFVCDTCPATFQHLSKLQRHKLTHSGEKKHRCKQCPAAFTSSTALRRHTLQHSGERPFRCTLCDRRFRDASNLRKHLQRHGDDLKCLCGACGCAGRGRPHRCPRCSHAFHARKDMTRHMHVHNDSKPFRCKVCSGQFRRKDNLERHIRHKHPDHNTATAGDCDLDALRERANVAIIPTETPKPKESSEKTQLEKLNPLPPMPKEVIQSMCDKDNQTKTIDKPEIDTSYILEANIARQSVIVAKHTTETQRHPSPETYVHKIKKSMAPSSKETMLPPIDTKKLFQFYEKVSKPETLDIGAPRPENMQMLKTILLVDKKNMNLEKKNGDKKKEEEQPPLHWRKRKISLNIDW